VYDIRRIAIQIEVYDLDLIFCVDLVGPLLWTIPGDWRYLVTQIVVETKKLDLVCMAMLFF
jgi:hypothetical protein